MAKGKKKTPKNTSAKKAKQQTPKKSAGSLIKTLLPGILGSVLSVAAMIAGIYVVLIQNGGKQTQEAFAQAQAHGYLQTVSQQALQLHALANAAANSDRIKIALISNDPNAIETVERSLEQEFPKVSNVEIYLKGKAKKDRKATPPISFAQLDLITRAEKEEEHLPEIHPHESSRYLTVASPIKDGNKVIGSLFATYDLKAITSQLPKVENDWGFLELAQKFGNNPPLVFYSSGNPASKKNLVQVVEGPIGHWTAHFYPSIAANIPAQNSTTFIALGAGAIVLVLIFTVLSYFLLSRALTQNATALTSAFNALTTHDKPNQTYTLEIFSSLAQTIERLFKEYDSSVRHQALKQKDIQQAPETPDPLYQKDDVLDIDISEEDTSLLDGGSSDPLAFEDDTPDAMDLDIVEMAEGGEIVSQTEAKPMPAEIFRAYDIRGIVGENLDASIATSVGMAIGSEAIAKGQTAIAVARDGRTSSPEIAEALVDGLMSTGINVIDIGMLPTPMLYYATKTLNTQSGVMVTGSHNPPNYNGFKIVIADQTLSGNQIQALRERIESGSLSQGTGSYETHDIIQDYQDRILNDVVLAKPMKIVIDCGNGVTGLVAAHIFDNLGCSVTTLYGDVDGNFPNHHPDPSKPENLQALIQAVQEQNAEIGIAFDGDGDRLGVVTSSGKIIWPDRLLMLYAKDLLSRNPGSDIIYDVKCSRDVAELVSNLGGRAIMSATGHSIMKAKMAETGAAVGGELSGHIFFNDRWYGFDDAIYSAARLLEILSMEPVSADEVFMEFPEKEATPEIIIDVPESKKFTLMDRLSEQGQFGDGNIVTLDGIRVDYPDGWGLIRASNTSPALVARFEADSQESLERIKGIFRNQLQAVDASVSASF